MAVLLAIADGHVTLSSIARAIDSSSPPLTEQVKRLIDQGLVKSTPDRAARFEITDKGRALIATYNLIEHEVRRHEASSAIPRCGFCGRVLGLQYYFTCDVCGATYCYLHQWKHARIHGAIRQEERDRGVEVSEGRQKVVLMMSEPKTLEQAFGVDGEPALQVAKMIIAQRRAEVADS